MRQRIRSIDTVNGIKIVVTKAHSIWKDEQLRVAKVSTSGNPERIKIKARKQNAIDRAKFYNHLAEIEQMIKENGIKTKYFGVA